MANLEHFSSKSHNPTSDSEVDIEIRLRSDVELNPHDADRAVAFAKWLAEAGRIEDAIELLQAALNRINERNLVLDLSTLYRLSGQAKLAVNLIQPLIHPNTTIDDSAWNLMYWSLVESDQLDAAEELLKSQLQLSPNDERATYLLASLQDVPIPKRSPLKHVLQTYELAADTFHLFAKYQRYSGPDVFRQILLDRLGLHSEKELEPIRTADLGCGSGALGPMLRAFSSDLTGIDLSPEMLSIASKTANYDQLICTDMLEYVSSQKNALDLIVAAESFNYFGDLSELIPASLNALSKNGWLVFSLQEGPLAGEGYHLLANGNFMHSPQYAIEQLGEAGLSGGTIRRVVLREVAGHAIQSLLIAVQRPE